MVLLSELDQLRQWSTIVIDSGDFNSIEQYHPIDATTNPSLLLSAAKLSQYHHLVDEAIDYALKNHDERKKNLNSSNDPPISHLIMERLLVNFGVEILKIIPGRVSTEVDAALSFNEQETINMAQRLIKMYEERGISKERILIKIASTWEGINAAGKLERDYGIHCNCTLLFGLPQAVAAAENGVTLISPFVGRILDWYKKHTGQDYADPANDPGVQSVQSIYNYLKNKQFKTVVMGASFRNTGEIEELAGIDFITISPKLLEELKNNNKELIRKLDPERAKSLKLEELPFSQESSFRIAMKADKMASDLLANGIEKFDADTRELEKWISELLIQRQKQQ